MSGSPLTLLRIRDHTTLSESPCRRCNFATSVAGRSAPPGGNQGALTSTRSELEYEVRQSQPAGNINRQSSVRLMEVEYVALPSPSVTRSTTSCQAFPGTRFCKDTVSVVTGVPLTVARPLIVIESPEVALAGP